MERRRWKLSCSYLQCCKSVCFPLGVWGEACSGGAWGRRRGPGCFTGALMTPRLGLTKTATCQGLGEALAEGCAAWPPPVLESLRPSLLQTRRSLFNRLCLPLSQCCHALKHLLKRGRGREGGWQPAALKPRAKTWLLELSKEDICPARHALGRLGRFFSSEVRDSHQKKQFGHCGSVGGERVEWVREVKASKFGDFQICRLRPECFTFLLSV